MGTDADRRCLRKVTLRILHDPADAAACLYDPATGEAVGPVFETLGFRNAAEAARAFLRALERLGVEDASTLEPATLISYYRRWRLSVRHEEEEHECY